MHATIELLSTFSLNIFDFSGRWRDRVIQKKYILHQTADFYDGFAIEWYNMNW